MPARRPFRFQDHVSWLIVFVVGVLIGLITSANSNIASNSFRIGLTIADPNAAPTVAPTLAMPPQASVIAVEGASSYHVSSLGLDDASRYFATSLPAEGYRLESQSGAGDRWESLWRHVSDNRCVAIEAQSVTGTQVIRIKTSSVICR